MSQAPAEILDMKVIETLRSFEREGEPCFEQLAKLFLEITPKRLAQMRRSLRAGDCQHLGREAHSLGSSSANLGAVRLHWVCRNLEAVERSADVAAATRWVECAEEEFAKVAQALHLLLLPTEQRKLAV